MPKRILVVEDEGTLRKALCLKIQNAGFEAVPAEDGEVALAILKEQPVDLILLDFIMPRMDGFTFLEKLRLGENETPVIGLTNLAQEEDREKAKSLGVVEYLAKSGTTIGTIADHIKKALN